MTHNACLVGYFGYGNAGDEQLLKKGQQLLADVGFSKFSILDKRKPFNGLSRLIIASHVVFLGGNIFQDKTSFRSLCYYVLVAWFARFLRKPVWLVAQGFGPLQRAVSVRLTAWVIRQAAVVIVRDEASADWAKQWTSIVNCMSDLAFYKSDLEEEALSRQVVGVSLKQCSDQDRLFIHGLLNRLCDPLTFIEAHRAQDLSVWGHDKYIQDCPVISLEELFTQSGQAPVKAVISMRYHTCVWAAIAGVPFVVLSDDPKCLQLAKELHQPAIPLGRGVDSAGMYSTVSHLLTHAQSYQRELLARRPFLVAKAAQLRPELERAL